MYGGIWMVLFRMDLRLLDTSLGSLLGFGDALFRDTLSGTIFYRGKVIFLSFTL